MLRLGSFSSTASSVSYSRLLIKLLNKGNSNRPGNTLPLNRFNINAERDNFSNSNLVIGQRFIRRTAKVKPSACSSEVNFGHKDLEAEEKNQNFDIYKRQSEGQRAEENGKKMKQTAPFKNPFIAKVADALGSYSTFFAFLGKEEGEGNSNNSISTKSPPTGVKNREADKDTNGKTEKYKACNDPHRENVIAIFSRLASMYKALGDVHRARAYSYAVQQIEQDAKKNPGVLLTDAGQLSLTRGIGRSLFAKIQEIIKNYDEVVKDPKYGFVGDGGGGSNGGGGITDRVDKVSKGRSSSRGSSKSRSKARLNVEEDGDEGKKGEGGDYFNGSGIIKEIKGLYSDPNINALMQLYSVYGIGPKMALKLHKVYGINSVAELKRRFYEQQEGNKTTATEGVDGSGEIKLNESQQIGLRHYEDLIVKIPYAECQAHHRYLTSVAKEWVHKDAVVFICGSHRRGLPYSGDIDVLISLNPLLYADDSGTKIAQMSSSMTSSSFFSSPLTVGKDKKSDSWGGSFDYDPNDPSFSIGGGVVNGGKPLLPMPSGQEFSLFKYVSALRGDGYILDNIAWGRTKYMGICKLDKKFATGLVSTMGGEQKEGKGGEMLARRIDIRWVLPASFPTALLYFTGSKVFNTRMREFALSKGYSLSEYGLYKLTDVTYNNKISNIANKSIGKGKVGKRGERDEGGVGATTRGSEGRNVTGFSSLNIDYNNADNIRGNELYRVPVRTEKDVFEAIGFPYLPPELRTA